MELSRTTRENFETMNKIQEQALQHIVQDSEISASRTKEEMLGFIQAVKDEIAEMKGGEGAWNVVGSGGTATPVESDRNTRRRIDVGDSGNPRRLVVLGFKRALVEETLRSAVDPILLKCATLADRDSIQVKA